MKKITLAGMVLVCLGGLPEPGAAMVSGTVTDSLTSSPVESVLVQIKGTSTTTYTDASGSFTLETPTGIAEPGQEDAGTLLGWEGCSGKAISIYSANGSRLDTGSGAQILETVWGLSDGAYLIAAQQSGQVLVSKLVKTGKRWHTGRPAQARSKAAAVTLVYSHKYYHTKEKAETEAQVKLMMWFPDETTSGVPAGTNLTTSSGRTISTANAVIEGERINSGGLVIAAANVTVRNCRIVNSAGGGGGSGVINIRPGASARIEHCTLDGNNDTHSAIWHEGSWMVAKSNNIYGVNDGIFCWDADNFTIEDNYVHDLTTEAANGHIDGFQTEGSKNGVIRHNNWDISQGQNACVAIWNGRRDSDNIIVDRNLMSGSGYAMYVEDYHPSEASPAGGYSVTNIYITNNVFSTKYYRCVGSYAIWYPRGAPTDQWNRSGNVWWWIERKIIMSVDNSQPPGCG